MGKGCWKDWGREFGGRERKEKNQLWGESWGDGQFAVMGMLLRSPVEQQKMSLQRDSTAFNSNLTVTLFEELHFWAAAISSNQPHNDARNWLPY